MNITDNLIRIQTAKTDIINSLKNKGVDIPDNTLINEIPTIIDNAEIGGGGDTPEIPELVQKYEGASVFRINVPSDGYEFAINLCNSTTATYDVDWGDGSLEYGKTTDEQHHIYSKSGVYDVNIYNLSKSITLGGITTISGSSSTTVYYLFNNTHNDYWLGNKYFHQTDNTTVTNILIGDKITSIGSSAFSNCISLQSVVISKGVTSISGNTFYNCYSLTSIIIPDSITSIGSNTFNGCSSLQSIVIPEGVTSIGSSAFEKCSSLTSIVIPNSVTSISSSAFNNCSSLQSIVIPEGVTSIESSTFSNCSSLSYIDLPSTIIKINNNAFYSCSSLQSIVIPNSVTSINNYAFYSCSSLQSIVIPNSVTSINNYTFNDCSSLQSIVIPSSVTSIGNQVFQKCTSLQSVVIPEGVTSFSNNTFSKCSSLFYVDLPSTLTSIGSTNFNGEYSKTNQLHYIISRAKTAPTIQSSTFQYSASNGILYIPKDADIATYQISYWKTNLLDKGWTIEYIEDIPEKVSSTFEFTTVNDTLIKISSLGKGQLVSEEKIDNKYIYNFDDTIYLGQNTLPNSLITTIKIIGGVELSNACFGMNTTLENIELPESLETIPLQCFMNSALQSIVIPSTIIELKNSCFYGCQYLHTITCKAMVAPTTQSESLEYIGTKVPEGTPKILRVPQGATGYDSGNWKSYVVDKGFTIEYIVPNTLSYTSYNGDVVTPYAKSFEGKNEIVSNVYENGKGVITFKEGLSEIYEEMYNKDVVSALISIEIPNGITRIGDYSFRSQYLTTLNVPNTVTYIGNSAFNGCTNLTEITLGSGVETIGQWAFGSCGKVSTITCMTMVAPSLNQSFLGVGSNVSGDKVLRVPEGAEGYDTWLSQLNGFTIEYI